MDGILGLRMHKKVDALIIRYQYALCNWL